MIHSISLQDGTTTLIATDMDAKKLTEGICKSKFFKATEVCLENNTYKVIGKTFINGFKITQITPISDEKFIILNKTEAKELACECIRNPTNSSGNEIETEFDEDALNRWFE